MMPRTIATTILTSLMMTLPHAGQQKKNDITDPMERDLKRLLTLMSEAIRFAVL